MNCAVFSSYNYSRMDKIFVRVVLQILNFKCKQLLLTWEQKLNFNSDTKPSKFAQVRNEKSFGIFKHDTCMHCIMIISLV